MGFPFLRSAIIYLLCTAFLLVAAASQKQTTNFSGDYTLIASEGEFAVSKGAGCTLNVQQSAATLEIERVEGGKKSSSKFSLKTGTGEFTGADGIHRKAWVQSKGGRFITDVLFVDAAEGSKPRSEFHIKEEWVLSDDAKTLILRRTLEIPGPQPTRMSGIETYSRK